MAETELPDQNSESDSFESAEGLPTVEDSGLIEGSAASTPGMESVEGGDPVESAREAVEAASTAPLNRAQQLEQERRARVEEKFPEISPHQQERLKQLQWKEEAKPGWDRLRHPIRNFRALFRLMGAQRRGEWDPAASLDEKAPPRVSGRDRLR